MTLRLIPTPEETPTPEDTPSPGPARAGQPWTDADYEALVDGCRRGTDLTSLSEELGRSVVAVLDRARRMLPAEERGLPRDRALPRLRELLEQDPDYDWDAAMRASPPPPPVEHPVYVRRGLAGLQPEELLAIAEVLVLEPRGGGAVRRRLLGAVRAEGLVDELGHRVGRMLVRQVDGLQDVDHVTGRWSPEGRWGADDETWARDGDDLGVDEPAWPADDWSLRSATVDDPAPRPRKPWDRPHCGDGCDAGRGDGG